MKKKMIALLAGALLTTAMAGNALAAFTDFDLIRVVYQRSTGTVEVATELGDINTLLAAGPNAATTGGAFTSVTGADLSAGDYWVAYFARDKVNKDLWFTGSADSKIGSLKTGLIDGLYSNTVNLYNFVGGTAGDTQVSISTTEPNSYKVKTFGDGFSSVFIQGAETTEASLADLANGPAVQDLYYFNSYGTSQFGEKIASIATFADGSTVFNYQATPIPPAFFLMGSGLLGMVGLRRKKA